MAATDVDQAEPGEPLAPGASAVERLLTGLNEPQKRAVEHGEGPLLVLAGAGSGKTRVLTHRVAYLVATGQAQPGEILAITFTNKAADEMRERVEGLVGRISRLMWVMTFHSACARILRREAERLGYKRAFTIYDQADSLRMVKRCMEELEVDPKRFTPRSIQAQISGAKNRLRDAESYREETAGFFEDTVGDVYALYERRMHEANAMDFDDLLVRTVNLLELFEDVRRRYQSTFRWVLVDEYQDTNRAQYRLLQLLSEEHGNLTVVGDDAQCLAGSTQVTMGDGSERAIRELKPGDEVLAGYGKDGFKPARVLGVYRADAPRGIAITTRGGRRLVSTPEHMQFAGYQLGITPQLHMTYLMWKRGVGFRIGTSRTYTNGQRRPIVGFRQRCFGEGADAVWVLSTHATEVDARLAETVASLKYRIPTLPFVARESRAEHSLVGSQEKLDDVFAALDTESAGRQVLADEGLSFDHPHHQASTYLGRRRVLTLTLCGEPRGPSALHRVTIAGNDEAGKAALEGAGLSVRAARRGTTSWRYESAFKNFSEALNVAVRVSDVLDVAVRLQGRFGTDAKGRFETNSLPCLPASSVRPGMAMFDCSGGFDIVESVEWTDLDEPVYDINVEDVHNFVANGLVTHNSIYSFRHAEVRNILDFERDFPGAEVVKLEQNYRSTAVILDAGNAVIANNRDQKPKRLWTEHARGEPVQLAELSDEHEEARYVAGEIERLVSEEDYRRDEVAVFYRTNAQSRVLEDALVRFDVPYQVIGGTKFYERAEIKDAIAYLSLLANPADAVCFARVVNSPRRGIGQTTQGRLLSHANTTGATVWEAMERVDEVPGLGKAARRAVERFAETMASLRERAQSATSVADLLEAVLSETGYADALEAERTIEAEGRLENLHELVGVAGEFDANRAVEGDSDISPLEEFLQQISLISDQDALRDDDGQITLMTLHNAKGLEFPIVFAIGCEEGVFPHSRSVEEGNLEEERRLCYVAITRAKQRFYMTCARRRSLYGRGYEPSMPSRFLGELPDELVERYGAPQPFAAGTGAFSFGGTSAPPSRPEPRTPTVQFRTGDDVVHASFGEGVVTQVEAGNVLVVRFAGDGAERKLMADYAPLRKAS